MSAQPEYLSWEAPAEGPSVPKGITTLVLESLAGKRGIFVPGRRATPYEATRLNTQIIEYSLRALLDAGWEVNPETLVGVPILTEGMGAHFITAFHNIWPGQKIGGQAPAWLKRSRVREAGKGEPYDPFEATVHRIDLTAFEHLEERGTAMFFDIGATGSTMRQLVKALLARTDKIERMIFASPCTSRVAATVFAGTAIVSGIRREDIAVVANEGLFGLHRNGTFLSLQSGGTITSRGNLALSKLCYPDPRFCHIGAGGWRANCQAAYERELDEDEQEFGKLPQFSSLEKAMDTAGVTWPHDFGPPYN